MLFLLKWDPYCFIPLREFHVALLASISGLTPLFRKANVQSWEYTVMTVASVYPFYPLAVGITSRVLTITHRFVAAFEDLVHTKMWKRFTKRDSSHTLSCLYTFFFKKKGRVSFWFLNVNQEINDATCLFSLVLNMLIIFFNYSLGLLHVKWKTNFPEPNESSYYIFFTLVMFDWLGISAHWGHEKENVVFIWM